TSMELLPQNHLEGCAPGRDERLQRLRASQCRLLEQIEPPGQSPLEVFERPGQSLLEVFEPPGQSPLEVFEPPGQSPLEVFEPRRQSIRSLAFGPLPEPPPKRE